MQSLYLQKAPKLPFSCISNLISFSTQICRNLLAFLIFHLKKTLGILSGIKKTGQEKLALISPKLFLPPISFYPCLPYSIFYVTTATKKDEL